MTPWGECQQPTDGICSFHEHWQDRPGEPDRYHHEKIAKNLIVPTFDWMTSSEELALINGRYRGDGRRIDQWVLPEPMLIDVGRL